MTQIRLRDSHFKDGLPAVTTMMIKPVASKANLLCVRLPLSTRLLVLAKGSLAIFIFALFGSSVCRAQGTYTAASCNQSDVNAVINGPTHKAVNGDAIIIPATGSPCTWTSGITISGVGIDITGTGTPNTGGGTTGAGTPSTTIIDNVPNSSNYGALFSFTGLAFGQTAKVELLNLSASGAAANSISHGPINFAATCTTSGCAQIRVDNINYTAGTWEAALAGSGMVTVGNVFGVVDHNTANEATASSPPLVQVNYNSWQGVGDFGDNSFASRDTLGTAQSMFIENNMLTGVRGSENDVPPAGLNAGGARYVCRFNTVVDMSGTGLCSAHGTAWSGRPRGQRQVEVYYNTVGIGAAGCDSVDGLNAGVGYYFSNSISAPGGGCNEFVGLDIPTFIKTAAPWGSCNGTGPYDQIPFTSTSACIDQVGSGAGTLLQGITPLLLTLGIAGWPNPVLDPVYEAGEKMTTGGLGTAVSIANDGTSTRVLFNRDVYAEVSQSAQSSPSSPFNGTVGTGYGTLANRPTSCTPHVGYWATDQGNWNGSGSGGQGELYICTGTNSWTMSYEPYTYPHPLTAGGSTTTGGPNAPTALTATVE
jgi:hypothetical protein